MEFNLAVLKNLDLFSVGIAVTSIVILGFSLFFNNRRSITNRTFLIFTLLTAAWGIANYIAEKVVIPELGLWLFRIVIALAIWHDFFIFQLFYVFPKEKVQFSKIYRIVLIPLVGITSVINLTPFVFNKIGEISPEGKILKIINGPGIILFSVLVFGLITSGIVLLIRKFRRAGGIEKVQLQFVLTGTFLTFFLLVTFNFILPAFFNKPDLIPLGAVFLFPFVAFTSYAILKHRFLNVKVIATEIFVFILAVATFFEVLLAEEPLILIFRGVVLLLVLYFGISLIRSVWKEIEQREELQRLNEQLDQLSKFKSQLLSIASHQIKAPLAAIKGYATLVLDGSYGGTNGEVKEALGKIK